MVCVPLQFVFLVDFQGHVLDNSRANTFPPSANNVIIGQTLNSPLTANQQWLFEPVGGTGTFAIANGALDANTAFVSYPAASARPQLPFFAQAATQIARSEALIFKVECNSTVPNAGVIRETVSGNVLTAWHADPAGGSTTTPVTYETFTGRPEQTWSFRSF
ncbi:hypothetical protein DFH09DRAFT_475258 [Mycena vulgaris]|nr:hypothetical protein DFH09DRAFT_475258 [Mycena vulgaris]